MKTLQEKEVPHTDSLKVFSQKVLIVLLFIGGMYTISLLSSILIILFFSGFLTILFSSFLDSMNKRKIPDWLGLIFIFLGIFLFFFIALFAIIPIFIKQIVLLFTYIGSSIGTMEALFKTGGVEALGFPLFLRSYIGNVDFGVFFEWIRTNISSISGVVGSVSGNLLQTSTSLISLFSTGVFQMMMIGIFTFFMSLERHSIKEFLYQILPQNVEKYMIGRESAFLRIFRTWMKGQIILGVTIFLFTLIGLFILQLFGIQTESIFTLALIAGLMEFIPYIGPFLALLPALAIVSSMGMMPVISIIILYIIIQQAENNIIVPMVMSKALDLPPFLIILVMTVMASLFGIAGILLAIPLAAILQIVVKDILLVKKEGRETK